MSAISQASTINPALEVCVYHLVDLEAPAGGGNPGERLRHSSRDDHSSNGPYLRAHRFLDLVSDVGHRSLGIRPNPLSRPRHRSSTSRAERERRPLDASSGRTYGRRHGLLPRATRVAVPRLRSPLDQPYAHPPLVPAPPLLLALQSLLEPLHVLGHLPFSCLLTTSGRRSFPMP